MISIFFNAKNTSNAVIDAWLASSGRDPKNFSPIERLLYIGTRGMGALEFRPALERANNTFEQLQLESLVDLAGRILDERRNQFDGLHLALQSHDEDQALKSLFQVGSSAGGQRPKAIIAIDEKTGTLCSGQVEAPEGYSYWLFKFDVANGANALSDPAGFGRVEYAYHLMAVARQIPRFNARKVIGQVVDAVRRWREFAQVAGMTDEGLMQQIERTHRLYLGEGV